MRSEIADELGAAARDGLAPVAGVSGEVVAAEGVDAVADDAGDHVGSSWFARWVCHGDTRRCFDRHRSLASIVYAR